MTSDEAMTRDELREIGRQLYGELWQSPLARNAGVDPRTMRRWVAGDRAIPEPAARLIRLIGRIALPSGRAEADVISALVERDPEPPHRPRRGATR